jgi:hypothetical protein
LRSEALSVCRLPHPPEAFATLSSPNSPERYSVVVGSVIGGMNTCAVLAAQIASRAARP